MGVEDWNYSAVNCGFSDGREDLWKAAVANEWTVDEKSQRLTGGMEKKRERCHMHDGY